MKKYLPYIIIAVVVLGGVGVWFAVKDNGNKESDSTATASKDDGKEVAKRHTDACKVFTSGDIATVFGGTFGEGEEEYVSSSGTPGTPEYEDLKGSGCKWEQDDDGTSAGMAASISFGLTINNHKDAAAAQQFMDDLHSPQTAEGKEAVNKPVDVDGVGDQAFFVKLAVADNVADKNESLYVRFGKQVFVLNATKLAGLDHEVTQANLTTLAKKL